MSFLHLVAKDLYDKNHGDFTRTVIVFPGKRANLYFNQELFQINGKKPLIAPSYVSMGELFQSFTKLALADTIDVVCRIYESYVKHTGDTQTPLEVFYGWGERILADFDDIDKNLTLQTSVRALLANVFEYRDLEDNDYLSEEQKKVLETFFSEFDPQHLSEIHERFLQLWHNLYNIYTDVRAQLAEEGQAYEGQLFRTVVDDLQSGRVSLPDANTQYVFVGHNVLSEMERQLMLYLKKEGRAVFYWDYDVSYVNNEESEAGEFMRKNLKLFPQSLSEDCFHGMKMENIEFVSSPTESAQARSVTEWVRGIDTSAPTGIVLASEMLLQPVLHSLPASVGEVNITKGFPLNHTHAYDVLDDLLKKAGDKLVLNELDAQLLENVSSSDSIVETEAFFHLHKIIQRFQLLESRHAALLAAQPHLREALLRQVAGQGTIPFVGEPAVGIQIMGMLETRCLDFDNVLLLSANEKVLPRASADNSFIPFAIREAFGLTTLRHRTAVFAYYFYRLLQRAKHVRILYNNSTEGLRTGEMSRFMTQLLVETNLPIKRMAIESPSKPTPLAPRTIEKPDDLCEQLTKDGVISLSPSAINKYLNCPLQFYFQRVRKFKEYQDEEGIIARNVFGLIFHKASELIYQSFNGEATKDKLEAILSSESLRGNFIRQAFKTALEDEGEVPFNSVIARAIDRYLRRMLTYDKSLAEAAPIDIKGTEVGSYALLDVPCADGVMRKCRVGGSIDRLDVATIEGQRVVRIVDYKTGGSPENLTDSTKLPNVFTESKYHYVLQTFLYALTIARDDEKKNLVDAALDIAPTLMFVNRNIEQPVVEVGKQPLLTFKQIQDDYCEGLKGLVAKILDVSEPFTPCDDARTCESCAFRLICFK